MQIGDLVMFKATGKMGIIKDVSGDMSHWLVLFVDGQTVWVLSQTLEVLCK